MRVHLYINDSIVLFHVKKETWLFFPYHILHMQLCHISSKMLYTVHSESHCLLMLRYVDTVVSINAGTSLPTRFICVQLSTRRSVESVCEKKLPYCPAYKTHFPITPIKCDLNSNCVLCAKGKYYYQTYKYRYIQYTTSLLWYDFEWQWQWFCGFLWWINILWLIILVCNNPDFFQYIYLLTPCSRVLLEKLASFRS
jgi:hypothetical protein